MPRFHRSPNGRRNFRNTFVIEQGGTGADTLQGAADNLGAISSLKAGLPNGPVPLNEKACISADFLGETNTIKTTIYGKEVMQPGETAVFVITNFDSFRTYDIIPLSGYYKRIEELVYYTAGQSPGMGGFKINSDTVEVLIYDSASTNVPNPANISYPANGSTTFKRTEKIVCEDFAMQTGVGSLKQVDWQLSRDANFTQIVEEVSLKSGTMTQWTPSTMEEGIDYFARARYVDKAKGAGVWGQSVAFTPVNDNLPNRQLYKTIPVDAISGSFFGMDVKITEDNTRMFVSAPQQNTRKGAVYVYKRNGINWDFEVKLAPSDLVSKDFFGTSVDVNIDGTKLIVGAPGDSTTFGSVYYFTQAGGVWTKVQKIVSPDQLVNERFGWSVALSSNGNNIVIGAKYSDKTKAKGGAAYIFKLSGGNYLHHFSILPASTENYGGVGTSVAISKDGKVVAVSAPNQVNRSGVVYLYRFTTEWLLETTLADIAPANAQAGYKIALNYSGNLLAIGAPFENTGGTDAGALYFYQYTSLWALGSRVVPAVQRMYDFFGYTVALSKDGEMFATSYASGGEREGVVVLGSVTNGVATILEEVKANDSYVGNYFGQSVAFSGNAENMLVGAPFLENSIGSIVGGTYIFTSP